MGCGMGIMGFRTVLDWALSWSGCAVVLCGVCWFLHLELILWSALWRVLVLCASCLIWLPPVLLLFSPPRFGTARARTRDPNPRSPHGVWLLLLDSSVALVWLA